MKTYKVNDSYAEALYKKVFSNNASELSEEIISELSTEDVHVITAYLCDHEENFSGALVGYARLNTPIRAEDKEENIASETNYIRFYYDIYSLGRIWNTMSKIEPSFPLNSKDFSDEEFDDAITAQLLIENTPWGE